MAVSNNNLIQMQAIPLSLNNNTRAIDPNSHVVVKLQTFNNISYVDIRYVHRRTIGSTNTPLLDSQGRQEVLYSKKGICMRAMEIPKLISALQELMRQSNGMN